MTFCGHVISDDIMVEETVGDNGNVVANFLVNGQGIIMNDGLESLVALFNFDEANQLVYVNYLSTVQEKLYNFQNQFVYSFKGNTHLTSSLYGAESASYTVTRSETLSDITERTGLFAIESAVESGSNSGRLSNTLIIGSCGVLGAFVAVNACAPVGKRKESDYE